jgi:sporulation protein YunB
MPRRGRWRANSRRISRGWRLIIALGAFAALLIFTESRLAPLVEELAVQKAHSAALSALETAVRRIMACHPEYHDYQQLMTLEKDSSGHVAVMIPNTMRLNELVSDIMLDVERGWSELTRQEISIPVGALSGSRVLSGLGPDLKLYFATAAAPTLSLKDEFISAGINQTRHRIWLDISGEVLIAAPLRREKVDICSSVLLAESVIVGPIPETYVNIDL